MAETITYQIPAGEYLYVPNEIQPIANYQAADGYGYYQFVGWTRVDGEAKLERMLALDGHMMVPVAGATDVTEIQATGDMIFDANWEYIAYVDPEDEEPSPDDEGPDEGDPEEPGEEIDEPDTPLAPPVEPDDEEPEDTDDGDGTYQYIDDEDAPRGGFEGDDEDEHFGGITIEDEDIPFASPKTGDPTSLAMLLGGMFAAAGTAVAARKGKKKEDEEE